MRLFHFPSTGSGRVRKFGFSAWYSMLLAPTRFFLEFLPLNSFFCPLSCEINSKVSSLLHKIPFLLSTLLPTRRHVCFQLMNDVIIPVYSEYSAPQSRMLGINSVYSRIGTATQSNGYLTIIPWDRVGYEVINNQRARSASLLWSLHIQQGRME